MCVPATEGRPPPKRNTSKEAPVVIDSRAISPELVLVDPELARVERARLAEPRATFTRPLLLPPTLTAPAQPGK